MVQGEAQRRPPPPAQNSAQKAGPTRRGLIRTAAWTTPVVLTAAPAPVFAASACVGTGVCPDLSIGTASGGTSTGVTNGSGQLAAGNGWSFSANGTGWSTSNTNAIGFVTSGTSGRFVAAAEPTTANRVLTLTQTGQPALRAACSYTLNVGIAYYGGSTSQPLVFSALAGTTQIASFTTSGRAAGANDLGIQTFTVPSGTTGVVSFRFTFGAAGDANDITIYSPSLTCS